MKREHVPLRAFQCANMKLSHHKSQLVPSSIAAGSPENDLSPPHRNDLSVQDTNATANSNRGDVEDLCEMQALYTL